MENGNDEAVSPVIGVILMVAVTVMLASMVLMFVFGMGKPDAKGPTAAVTAMSAPETSGIADIKIQHKAGDRLVGGDWRLSIVPAGEPPVYKISNPGSDFKAGDQIITPNLTSGTGYYTVTNSSVYTDGESGNMSSGGKYDVKMIIYPFKTMVLDTVVEVR